MSNHIPYLVSMTMLAVLAAYVIGWAVYDSHTSAN